MKAVDLVSYLGDLIKKSYNSDEIEVFIEQNNTEIDVVKLSIRIDSNGSAEEYIEIY